MKVKREGGDREEGENKGESNIGASSWLTASIAATARDERKKKKKEFSLRSFRNFFKKNNIFLII